MTIADPRQETLPDVGGKRTSQPQQRDLGEVFAPAMAALFELGAELDDVLEGHLDEFARARLERSISGIDAVLAELWAIRADSITIDVGNGESPQ